ncbi:hypothetical protein FOMPIDRAFT_1129763, partial [Fomitopsis schrenkii]
MTDFGSQGRTRSYNPCHLTNCRTHQSLYTCLSRSSSYDGTLIIGSLDQSKITGGKIGSLWREFRELEILNQITLARAKGELAGHIVGDNRAMLVRAWQKHKGVRYVPPGIHSALDWSNDSEDYLQPLPSESDNAVPSESQATSKKCKVLEKSNQAVLASPSATKKRKLYVNASSDTTTWTDARALNNNIDCRIDRSRGNIPYGGPTWDSVNWSCAYDSVLSILVN